MATPTKKTAKKTTRTKKAAVSSTRLALFDKVEHVDINTLKPHPKNPNIGDVDAIMESILENGLAQPIVVNQKGKLKNVIVGGHHTWMAMRRLNTEVDGAGDEFTKIPVLFVDLDEQQHLKLMLALNRTADLRHTDDSLLLEIMNSLPDLTGTGYTDMDLEEYAAKATQMATEAASSVAKAEQDRQAAEDARKRAESFQGAPLGEEDGFVDDDSEEADVTPESAAVRRDEIQAQNEDLSGAFTLKDDMVFDGQGPWSIPRLRTDMLMTWEELPTNLETWAGSATKDWPDPDTWWLYNWGIDSASGMRDVSKVIVAFYCHDEYFENWWWHAKKYTTKVLNSGIKYIVMPDFSMHTPGEESRVLSLWSFYRSRWLARYFQECGLKLIPEVTWATADEEFLTKYILPITPKDVPLLCIQVQTIEEDSPLHAQYIRQVQLILDTVKPKALLVYHGKQGERLFTDGSIKFKGNIRLLPSRMYRLAEQAKKKQKKKTI